MVVSAELADAADEVISGAEECDESGEVNAPLVVRDF
jgi:hypothetical protein